MVPKNQQLTQQLKSISKELLFVLFLLALVLVLKPIKASAATLNVVTGSSAVNADGNCQLEEAIGNINDGAQTYTDCAETGTYGTDDTINLPAGTITGTGSSLSTLEGDNGDGSLTIVGQGKDSTIIEQTGFYLIGGSGLDSVEFKDFMLSWTGLGVGIDANNIDVVAEGLEMSVGGGGSLAISVHNGDLTVKDSIFYQPDFLTGSGMPLIMSSYLGENGNISVENSTFSQAGAGLLISAGSGYQVDATIKNSTFTDLHGDESTFITTGIAVSARDGATINYATTNNTFSNISNTGSGLTQASAIIELLNNDSSETINHTTQNDLYAVGNGTDAVNYSQLVGSGSGSGVFNTTSLGGNISSDNSFSAMLNQSSDKHNQTTLADFLGILTDNGGPVPTLALEEGSPAIDSGTNVSGMTTDARGVTRPQGASFDSGAYELEQTTPEEPGGSESGSAQNTTTVVNPGLTSPSSSVSQFSNKPITITTPTGTTITSSNTVTESSLANQDGNNQYPLGLVNFTFNTSQTDNQVTLTFITDLKPNQVKPRKYNPDSKAYTDLTNYTLTETTINGQHALVLTYTITDNGDLDTNKTTGVISDPVGLAMTNSSYDQLANTGKGDIIATISTGLLLVTSSIALMATRLKDKVKYSFKR